MTVFKKESRTNFNFMTFNPRDHYFKKAKKEGYKARSVFKLDEIHQKFHLFQSQSLVLDLGCSPGSWSQWISKQMGSQEGLVVGIDLKPVDLKLSNAVFLQGDLFELDLKSLLKERGLSVTQFDLVVSDMAPKTTGIKMTDQARSLALCFLALDVASQWLKPGGHIVVKFFHSEDFKDLKKRMELEYKKCEVLKPQSTRSESKEIFLIGLGKRQSSSVL
jgi:23S rRNA (uridine2552-2'-O)-methyltransferase